MHIHIGTLSSLSRLSPTPAIFLWSCFCENQHVLHPVGVFMKLREYTKRADNACKDTRRPGESEDRRVHFPVTQSASFVMMIEFLLFLLAGSLRSSSCVGTTDMSVPIDASRWIDALKLEKQPYGNYFRSTYDSSARLRDQSFHGDIYNLFAVEKGDATKDQAGFPLHMLDDDETYHYYGGDGPLALYLFNLTSGRVRNVSIGNDVPERDVPQFTIPSGTWSGALLTPGTTWALTGAGTTPGFRPRDSHMLVDNETLLDAFFQTFPHQSSLLTRLTSF